MRASLLVVLASLASAVARADAVPPPGRPEWPDTPLPMPDDPPALAAWCLALALGVTMIWAHTRKARCAS